MSLPRLRLEKCSLENGVWTIDPQEAKHLVKVRRCYSGSLVEGLLAGQKIQLKLICDGAAVQAVEVSRAEEALPVPQIHLLLGVLKADQFDLALRFSAEIGVYAIHLLQCGRSVPQYEPAAIDGKMRRWQKILDEATKQAGSTRPPQLLPPVPVAEFDFSALPQSRFAALLDDDARPIREAECAGCVAVAIGPEGDWEPEESALLLARSFQPVSLGSRVLRASTAVAVACSWFMLAANE